ncbi:hypothetical protein GH714_035087 [Hevea brasiliensis]|uniref:Carbohydrate kinase PfkB domain-containing protein n=1 Tax=Hevea brasiliensis TaxID=3981 RepID=A0A6A6MJ63_HEVBR|nr:hypothetical protein GH714_035087 [Hevea brasiliensis]
MVTASHKTRQVPTPRVLIVGNYCHDVLIQNDTVVGESLGGASSFIASVLDGMSIPCSLVAKVGHDFRYQVNHIPILVPASKTTVFHAYFDSGVHENGNQDRVLKRTLERMIEICDVVLVDIQALIRDFDAVDGTVKLVDLRETGFRSLLPRIGVLKVSSEEAVFMDVEEVRKWCCVVVTKGEDGCKVCWKDGEMEISPFLANQEDPTGAGDSFLGGFVTGLMQGLAVPEAALLGNFFGSLTVEQIGLPKFDSRLLQRVKDEVQRRKTQCLHYEGNYDELMFLKPEGHEQFHSSLGAAKLLTQHSIQESKDCSGQPKLAVNPVNDEAMQTADGKP